LDQVSQRRFLVDTGASYSIFPHWSSSPPTGPLRAGPSGTAIPCWGEKEFELSFDNKKFNGPLLLAAVKFPILGLNFCDTTACWSTRRQTAWCPRRAPPWPQSSASCCRHINPLPVKPAPEQPSPDQPAPERPAPEWPGSG
jgi:hypothetical protein